MRSVTSEVGQDLLVVAPGVLQRVGQDRQPVKAAVVVNGAGVVVNGGRPLPRLDDRGAEWVPDDVSEQVCLREPLTPSHLDL